MSLIRFGSCGFVDVFTPAKGKSEWGMDTLTRQMRGARSLLDAFLDTLEQGQRYGSSEYFLQSWEPDNDPVAATVSLLYKGLLTGGTPKPKIRTEIAPASGSISKDFTGEGGGLGRIYRRQPLYELDAGIAATIGQPDDVFAYREIYTTGVLMDFTYDAIQTTYRYIVKGKPSGPKYFNVDIPRIPVVKRAKIVTSDGAVYGSNAPTILTTGLTPDVLNRVVGFEAEPVIGTPYFECEDVVRRELAEGVSDSEGTFGGG